MASKAMTGKGVTVTVGGTSVGQLTSANITGSKWSLDDITNAGSPAAGGGVLKESLPTVLDPGELQLKGVWVYNDAGQQALNTNFANGALVAVVVQLPMGEGQATTGASLSFSGYVTDPAWPEVQFDKTITWTSSIKCNTVVTVAYGS